MKILQGDCLHIMKTMPDNSIDSIVTDPPYGLSFMGKKWDYDVPSQEVWEECLRILKPGGYLLAFAGTRTQHRMAVRIEDAGFEIRDIITWVYGSGFPKSLNVGKAVDKLQGNEREVIDRKDVGHDITNNAYRDAKQERKIMDITKGTSDFEGWGTALKPAFEPITIARKPLSENTVAENVLKWGTGGINIDRCRVGTVERINIGGRTGKNPYQSEDSKLNGVANIPTQTTGRYPANFIHDGSNEVLSLFPKQAGAAAPVKSGKSGKSNGIYSDFANKGDDGKSFRNDSGSAARFFYCAKASKSERGLNNNHPTVKPVSLIRYLIKLVTPKKGIVLDPFGGSGTTLISAIKEGFDCIIIEKETEYINIINIRAQQYANDLQSIPSKK
jgi:DNA modification methylase